ncbi:bll5822 [Bradyrhizobium diazoefficiens USDA 110]|uniref:Bll5822 protein n=1 Tax=Bradyrhizobium diazoefficiens (strain JCM 10833 / BCRC 13528 / IAM 13628 / NBRC 14792 / USDA 110) TaxID=224911 RepID=Q89I17_BRADU|nr:hypothetical protein AAV28_26645 [Bradyrhizobium diazoefficiens USDA 110]APO51882.1 hypothetical protein BD122_16470 [Bradyrhizobium diazoefficiens]QHP69190.1 hypothetical protein EI171_19060 [Bradyrhizobium sp. LCT2]KOY08154.1 hypothetical protein AF336_21850 [Bradyrhizobium diazoefficiens]PDT58330.1 hypothetical protein CO678_29455 [Bradyrhizobium diazoefficiens]
MAAAINPPRPATCPRSTASRRKSRIEGSRAAARYGNLRAIARSFGLHAARRLACLAREPLLNPATCRAQRFLDGKEGLAVLLDQRSLRHSSHEMKGAVAAGALVYLQCITPRDWKDGYDRSCLATYNAVGFFAH